MKHSSGCNYALKAALADFVVSVYQCFEIDLFVGVVSLEVVAFRTAFQIYIGTLEKFCVGSGKTQNRENDGRY